MKSDVLIMFGSYELTKNMDLIESPDFSILPLSDTELEESENDKKLSLKFQMESDDFVQSRDELALALYGKKENKLTISIFENRYWLMSVEDSTSFVRSMDSRDTIDVEIEFKLSKNRSFSTVIETFSAKLNSENVLEFEINNSGTVPVPVDYRIKLKKESGFIGLVSEYGAMQFGLVNEADGTMVESDKSKQLTNNINGNFNNWTNGTTFYQDQNKKSVTTMSANATYGLGILPASFSNTANSNFFGAIKEIPLSESARNWYLWAQAWFETGRMGQTGMWTLAIVDEQNKPIAAYILRKGDTTGNKAQCYFWLNGKIVKTFDFTASYWEKDNPYGSESKNARRNPFDIRKEGNRVRFFWRGSYYYYTDSAIENVKASKVQFFAGQFKGRNTSTQKVTHMYINNLAFTKLNVETWRDDPNRFPNNSEIFISGSETLLYLNEMPRPDDEIRGSTWFKVPPGLTTVQLILSDFSEVETATAELRREYL
ncbi:phage tail domain-containing protein [Enterococcus casseliflavus]|uniref:phage tail domain-containing protein n=1 Tax=Enterococcus casseliflavus TaxID=37734 RepID=UPI000763C6E5|nr:phage tail domain-containing protein [Enterococcus casseliflavus]QQU21704.1 phage tail family protein [Enterococcus casseliflavus]STQ31568.1 Phage tail protein [Enterococcus casseliflavus]